MQFFVFLVNGEIMGFRLYLLSWFPQVSYIITDKLEPWLNHSHLGWAVRCLSFVQFDLLDLLFPICRSPNISQSSGCYLFTSQCIDPVFWRNLISLTHHILTPRLTWTCGCSFFFHRFSLYWFLTCLYLISFRCLKKVSEFLDSEFDVDFTFFCIGRLGSSTTQIQLE